MTPPILGFTGHGVLGPAGAVEATAITVTGTPKGAAAVTDDDA